MRNKIIDFKRFKDSKLNDECDLVLDEISKELESQGKFSLNYGRIIGLQGFKHKKLENLENLNKKLYLVDNELIKEGWTLTGTVIPLNGDFFKKRKDSLSRIFFKKIKEKKTEYTYSGKSCVVLYGKN